MRFSSSLFHFVLLALLALLRRCVGLINTNDTADELASSLFTAINIPRDFRTALTVDHESSYILPRASFLRTALYAMKYKAHVGYNDIAPDADYSIQHVFRDTTISVEPSEIHGAEFQNRVIMWGLAVCTTLLVSSRNFVEHQCYLSRGYPLNDHHVGTISYLNSTRVVPPIMALPSVTIHPSVAATDVSSSIQVLRRGFVDGATVEPSHVALNYSGWSANVDSLDEGPSNIPKMTVRAGDWGGQLYDLKLFVAAYESLIDRASKPDRSSPIPDYTFTSENAGILINHHPRPVRGIPLPLYGLIVDGLGRLPVVMNNSGIFRECNFVILVDDNPIVDGYVRLII